MKDIENNEFEKHRGDEMMIKMYLKRLIDYYELDNEDLIDQYGQIIQDYREHHHEVNHVKKESFFQRIDPSYIRIILFMIIILIILLLVWYFVL